MNAPEPVTEDQLRRHVASPERLPLGPHPEWVRKSYMNHYARLQQFKLKVVIGLAVLVWIAHGCPY